MRTTLFPRALLFVDKENDCVVECVISTFVKLLPQFMHAMELEKLNEEKVNKQLEVEKKSFKIQTDGETCSSPYLMCLDHMVMRSSRRRRNRKCVCVLVTVMI